ncbi:SDR family NAD(P)-dependent oxidoreductase [Bradyrhizobium cenepequi]|uniref:SDR family NAD(P)-dependent oxidoreductase n=1 Tax=Bradyrhizobium cenepequi TaxID=2821403 RepID=UPI001CE2346F|nr:SDR family oxidoreductase [Bradyrhizobium cenepequi]MCA6108484.1 SDR family oxidoreductase [Bradyrhizobium cenepequi]
MKLLAGKIALVTGASRGIGRAIAIRLAQDGAVIGVHYRVQGDKAKQTLDLIRAQGGDGFLVAADLADAAGASRLAEALIGELRARRDPPLLDILVNNAGIDDRKTIEQVTEADFDRMLQINFKSPFFLIQKLLPVMADGGRIINISSMAARLSFPTMPVYASTKAALSTLSRVLAAHLGPRGITVNAVLPGATSTDLNPAASDPQRSSAIRDTVALGRIADPGDIAPVVAFLASREGGWITGETIEASGGQRL